MTTLSFDSRYGRKRKGRFRRELSKNGPLFLFLLPGALYLFIFAYLPIPGALIAFKNYTISGTNIFTNFINSKWVGFDNFRFLFATPDAFTYTRNTVGYNFMWIVLGLVVSVAIAVTITELWSARLSKVFQTTMLLPFFLSWVVVSYLVYALLNPQFGVINTILINFGLIAKPIQWYLDPKHWPYILTIANLWKYSGYNCIIYISAISGLDMELYDAAAIDGAGKWQQTKSITLPLLQPMMITMTLLAFGRIFYGNFDMFFNLPMGSAITYPTTMVIDTYVYNSLQQSYQIGITTACGLYQSVVGCFLVIAANLIVRKFDPDSALF